MASEALDSGGLGRPRAASQGPAERRRRAKALNFLPFALYRSHSLSLMAREVAAEDCLLPLLKNDTTGSATFYLKIRAAASTATHCSSASAFLDF